MVLTQLREPQQLDELGKDYVRRAQLSEALLVYERLRDITARRDNKWWARALAG